MEAAVKAKNLGYQQMLMLSNCKKTSSSSGQEASPRLERKNSHGKHVLPTADGGLDCRLIFVSKVILNYVWSLAVLASKEPTYYCWPTMEHYVNANYG